MLYQLSYTHRPHRPRDTPPAGEWEHTHPRDDRNAECEPPTNPPPRALCYLPAVPPPVPALPSPLRATIPLLLAGFLAGCSSPAPEAPLCSSVGTCSAGLCVAGRCRAEGKSPAPAESLRLFLAPRDIAVLRPDGPTGGRIDKDLPEMVALGREGGGDLVLLLRFAATWPDDASIASAFLVLDPAPGAPPPRRAAPVEVARILEPWHPSTASWGRQPRLSLPENAGLLRSTPPAPARIEVTRFVRDWAKRRPDDHGIALLIDGGDILGTTYSMGVTDGTGPLLEVYVR